MRTLRLSLAGTVILVLLGGVVPVTAQQEESLDPMRASQFTGTWTDGPSDDDAGPGWAPGPDYYEAPDWESVHLFEASDPRISGTWTQDLDMRAFPIDEDAGLFAVVGSGAVRIENEDGAWGGMFDNFGSVNTGREWYRLEGEGAYEGLTAVLRWFSEGDIYEGIIIPGLPPDQPAPITAAVEVAPEPPAPAGSAWVTGTVTCDVTTAFTTTIVGDVEQKRGEVRQCVWASSDPRISGPLTVTQDADCYTRVTAAGVPACLWWGTFEAPGWTGSLITTTDPSGRFLAHIIQTGRGANAGLTFVGTNNPEGWSGHLYEGDPAPSGPLPSPASE
jgi:hypothetical protein